MAKPAGQHPRQPVESGIRVASPKTLMKGGDHIVVLLSLLIIEERLPLHGLLGRGGER
jgi:hypothetical protein